jgi:hypothetical protein
VQHRWKNNLDDRLLAVFEEAAERVKWAWDIDRKSPKSYPVNTEYAFSEIQQQLRKADSASRVSAQRRTAIKLPPPPRKFSELVEEKDIKAIYEDQNVGSYQEALREAGSYRNFRAWKKILRAVDAAYLVPLGTELAPKPRVHFLHRELLRIADSEPLAGLTVPGLVGFLDDLCPCGKKHKLDAVRKLQGRFAKRRRH